MTDLDAHDWDSVQAAYKTDSVFNHEQYQRPCRHNPCLQRRPIILHRYRDVFPRSFERDTKTKINSSKQHLNRNVPQPAEECTDVKRR